MPAAGQYMRLFEVRIIRKMSVFMTQRNHPGIGTIGGAWVRDLPGAFDADLHRSSRPCSCTLRCGFALFDYLVAKNRLKRGFTASNSVLFHDIADAYPSESSCACKAASHQIAGVTAFSPNPRLEASRRQLPSLQTRLLMRRSHSGYVATT